METKKMNVPMFIGMALVASTIGCTPQNVREDSGLVPGPSIDQSYPGATLILGSEALVGVVHLTNPKVRSIGELDQAQVTVQNLTDTRYTLEYKFDWEDYQGFAAGSPGAWHRFILTPRQVKTFSSTGNTPDATNIVFTVRLPDDIFIHSDRKEKDNSSNNTDN